MSLALYRVKCARDGSVYITNPLPAKPTHCKNHPNEVLLANNVTVFQPLTTITANQTTDDNNDTTHRGAAGPQGEEGKQGPAGCGQDGEQGPMGEAGYGMEIKRIFHSEQEVKDDTCQCKDGDFAIIETGDANDSAHGRVYMCSGGEWVYMHDITCCHDLMRGPRGFRGEKGDVGGRGCPGETGDRGGDGTQGQRGPNGCKGPNGKGGTQGPDGKDGDQGCAGEGTQGKNGVQGKTGDSGERGEQGFSGDKGEKGPEGPTGPACSERGPAGEKGDKGDPGQCCHVCAGGERGQQGAQGSDGMVDDNPTFDCVTLQTIKFSSCTRPTQPALKQMYMDDDFTLWVWNGSAWLALAFTLPAPMNP